MNLALAFRGPTWVLVSVAVLWSAAAAATEPAATAVATPAATEPAATEPAATEPATPDARVAEPRPDPVSPAPGASPVAEAAEERAARVRAFAKRYGWQVVERNGNLLVCREQAITATRVRKQRRCLTPEHAEQEATAARSMLDEANRGHTPREP